MDDNQLTNDKKERTYEDVLGVLEEETEKDEGEANSSAPVESQEPTGELIPEEQIENEVVKVEEKIEESPGGRGSLPVEMDNIQNNERKRFPWEMILLIFVVVFGTLLALVFFGPLGSGDKKNITTEESEITGEEGIPTDKQKEDVVIEEANYENYENKALDFSVKYLAKRQVTEDKNSKAGNRVVFWLSSGLNLVVHAGKTWSYDNPERVEEAYTSTIAGVRAYEFKGDENQKIVDFEKGGVKYTVQCVHQKNEGVLKECGDFLNSFRFLE